MDVAVRVLRKGGISGHARTDEKDESDQNGNIATANELGRGSSTLMLTLIVELVEAEGAGTAMESIPDTPSKIADIF